MTKTDDAMAHSKKKRDDDPPPANNGQKPIQLQRRRVWRACESCRSVLFSHRKISPSTSPPSDARRSNAMDVNLLARSAPHRAHNAPGFRQKTALHSADSTLLPISTSSTHSCIHQLCTRTRSTSPSHGISLYTDRPRLGATDSPCCWLATSLFQHTNCDIRSWKPPARLASYSSRPRTP